MQKAPLSMHAVFDHRSDIRCLFCAQAQPTTVHYRKNQFVFAQGARSESLFYIQKGTVKLSVTSSTGKEALIGFYATGQVFGESSLVSGDTIRFHNAIAVTSLITLRIDRVSLLRRVHSDSTVAYSVMNWLLIRNEEIQQDLVSQLLDSSEERLAVIIRSVAQLASTDRTGLAPKLTQQDLANRTGLSRQRINALMTRLKKSGVIDQNGNLKPRQHGPRAS
jgi:CRP/FNR family cyclic AMP-dependent transcriptional regulator